MDAEVVMVCGVAVASTIVSGVVILMPSVMDHFAARRRANHVKQIIDTAQDYDAARDFIKIPGGKIN